MATAEQYAAEREEARLAARMMGPWWLFLVTGVLWLIYAWIVLSFDIRTVWAVVIFAGFMFFGIGITEFVIAGLVRDWRWLHVLFGIVGVGAGVVAFVWPEQTFLTLATLIAWYLLLKGTLDVVMAFLLKQEDELWWLRLAVGIAEILIGFWAVGYSGRSIVLLVVWVAAAALAKGITDIVLAFRLRSLTR